METTQSTLGAGSALAPLFRKPSYTPAEIASILSISLGVVYRLIGKGDLKSAKVGASLRVNRSELQRYIDAIGLEVEAGR